MKWVKRKLERGLKRGLAGRGLASNMTVDIAVQEVLKQKKTKAEKEEEVADVTSFASSSQPYFQLIEIPSVAY